MSSKAKKGAYHTLAVCVKSHIFAAVYGFGQLFWRQRGLDVLGSVRQLPTIANFLAVKRSFSVGSRGMPLECFS